MAIGHAAFGIWVKFIKKVRIYDAEGFFGVQTKELYLISLLDGCKRKKNILENKRILKKEAEEDMKAKKR